MMLNMRLQELTKEAQPPFLASIGGVGNLLAGIRAFNFLVVPNAGDLARGLEKGLAEVFRIDQHGFTPTELERAKETVLASYERNYNERDKTESSSFARELSGLFQEQESVPGIEVEYELAKEFLAEIQIAEVNKMVSELITSENVIFTLSLPEGGADQPTEADILDIYKRAEKAQYTAYIDDLGDAKLMKDLPKAGKITSTKKLPNFDITEMKLSNGARVLLKPTDFKNDQILFHCWAGGGTSLYSDQDFFIADDAASIIDEAGLGEFTSTQLSKLLQSKMIRLSPYVSDFTQGMSGSLTPKDKEIFFQLLNMQFTQPRKDKDAFASYITKSSEVLRNRDRDPQNAFRDTVNAVLGSYHPRCMPLTSEKLETFELDKAFKIYQERFADAGNFTFLFVGAFKIDEIKPLIEQYIASLPATKKNEKAKDLGIKAPKGIVEKVVKKGIEPKATVRLVLDTDNAIYSSEEILKMNVMNEILNIRLREEIREEKGGVYGIGGRANMNYFPQKTVRTQIHFGCDPARVEELIPEVKKVFDELQTKASAENMNKAKEIMKKEFETRSKENNYWLSVIQAYDYTNRNLAFLNGYDKKIDSITEADVIATAKKYLDYNKNFIRIVQMPEDDDE
jgi:zinc protease